MQQPPSPTANESAVPEVARPNYNDALANRFLLIATYYDIEKDVNRARTYRNGSALVRNAPFVITRGVEAQVKIKGIGPSIAKDIDEFLANRRISRLENLEQKHINEKRVLDQFMQVYGIGPVSATKYYEMGFRTVSQLLEGAPLTAAQRLGATYFTELQQRIPRSEMNLYDQTLSNIFSAYTNTLPPGRPPVTWQIVGSYRRGEPESGDIDVLIQAQPGLDLRRVVELFKQANIIVGDLALGPSKYLAISRLSGHPARRLDLLVIQPESWAYAQMYFTGSQRHNVLMRQRALDLGLTLNEYRLLNTSTGETYPAGSEEQIYTLLGLQYISPVERTRNLPQLPLLPSGV